MCMSLKVLACLFPSLVRTELDVSEKEHRFKMDHILLLILVLGVLGGCLGQTSVLSVTPADAVHQVGDNAQFFCKITANPADEAIEWKRTLIDGTDESIYKTFKPNPIDKAKYEFNLTAPLESDIIVKHVTLADVGVYRCQPMSETSSGEQAYLVVVGSPVISMAGPLLAGGTALVTCDIYYLGSQSFSLVGLEPELVAMIGADRILAKVEKTLPIISGEAIRARLDYNLTLTAALDGKNFTCGARVQRQSPTRVEFEISEAKTFSITFPVHSIKIVEPREFYYPNELINCTAEGNPEPQIKWVPLYSEGARYPERNGVLRISETMVGDNEWKCMAENMAGGIRHVVESKSISFKVLSPTEPPAEESIGADVTTIVIAVVVPVVVILVVVVVVCIICIRKKKQSAKSNNVEVAEGAGNSRQKNKIYKPVSTKPDGQVSFEDNQKASYKVTGKVEKPMAAPRR